MSALPRGGTGALPQGGTGAFPRGGTGAFPRGGTRVLHVVRQFAPSIGGLEEAVMNLARHQREAQDLDARVVTLDRLFTDRSRRLPKHETIRGIPVERLPFRGSRRYPLAPSVLSAIRGADLVHVHGIDFFFDFLAATRPLHRRRMVASTHGGFFHTNYASGLKRRWFNTITRRSVQAYDAIVACSQADEAMFRPLAPPAMTLIENGIDTEKFAAADDASRNPRQLLTFGRLATHKRIGLLFTLLRELQNREPGWALTVAGAPWDQDEAALRAAAKDAGVAEAVRFVMSPGDAALGREITAAGFFLCASSYEGFGIAAVEAAAAGLLPVLSNIAPFCRLTERLGEGFTFDPAAPQAAADWIMAAVANPGGLAERRADMRRRAAAYAWSNAAAEYAAVYARVLAGVPAQ